MGPLGGSRSPSRLAPASRAFLLALNYSSVANVLFMQAAAPMLAALLGWALLRERVDGRTWLALVLAGVGVATMADRLPRRGRGSPSSCPWS